MVPRSMTRSLVHVGLVSCLAAIGAAGCAPRAASPVAQAPAEGAVFQLGTHVDGAARIENATVSVDGYVIESGPWTGGALLATPWLTPGAHTIKVDYEVSTACSVGDVGRRTVRVSDTRLVAVPPRALVDVSLEPRGLFYAPSENYEVAYTVRGDAPTTTITARPAIAAGPDACGPAMQSPEEIAARRPRKGRPGCSGGGDAFASSSFAGTLSDPCR